MKDVPKVLLLNPGTLHAFRLASELDRHALLHRFATSIYVREKLLRPVPTLLQKALRTRLETRMERGLRAETHQYPVPELLHLFAKRFGIGNSDVWIRWRNRRFG